MVPVPWTGVTGFDPQTMPDVSLDILVTFRGDRTHIHTKSGCHASGRANTSPWTSYNTHAPSFRYRLARLIGRGIPSRTFPFTTTWTTGLKIGVLGHTYTHTERQACIHMLLCEVMDVAVLRWGGFAGVLYLEGEGSTRTWQRRGKWCFCVSAGG
jgi:hypothetical protein